MLRTFFRRCVAGLRDFWWASKQADHPHAERRPRGRRLALEYLEDRDLLANYIWYGGVDTNWSTAANFRNDAGVQYQVPPRPEDTVIFDNRAGQNTASVVNQNFTITRLEISHTWEGDLFIPGAATLTITTSGLFAGGGTFGGNGNLILRGGTYSYRGGIMDGTGTTTVEATGILNIEGGSGPWINARTVNNAGTIGWSSINLTLSSGATINNSGTFTINSGETTIRMTGDGTVSNTGTVTKEGTGTASIEIPFNHQPTDFETKRVTINAGLLLLRGGGSSSGQYRLANNTQLHFLNGPQDEEREYTWAQEAPPMFRFVDLPGSEKVVLNSNVFLPYLSTAEVSVIFDFNGGEITGLGDITFNRDLTWRRGTRTGGTTTLDTLATAWLFGGLRTLDGGLFVNNGIVNQTGTFYMENSAIFENRGTFDIQDDSSILTSEGQPRFENYGTLQKSAGTGISEIQVQIDHMTGSRFLPLSGTLRTSGLGMSGGQVQLQGGNLIVDGNFTQGAGTTEVGSGLLTVNGQFLVNGGTVSVAGGAIEASEGMEIAQGATLFGHGSITTPLLVNRGTIDIAGLGGYSVGTLYVYGNYQQTASGLLIIDLAANGTCDTLAIAGGGQAGGTLQARWLDGPPQGSTTYQVVAVLWAIPPVDPFSVDLPPGVTVQPLPTGINLIFTP
ncbi:MAG: hypothetical protein L0Z62_34695 [Gemmataceae bacterium]|nr:hypothetical protein [Gemmataceae bacterium]